MSSLSLSFLLLSLFKLLKKEEAFAIKQFEISSLKSSTGDSSIITINKQQTSFTSICQADSLLLLLLLLFIDCLVVFVLVLVLLIHFIKSSQLELDYWNLNFSTNAISECFLSFMNDYTLLLKQTITKRILLFKKYLIFFELRFIKFQFSYFGHLLFRNVIQ